MFKTSLALALTLFASSVFAQTEQNPDMPALFALLSGWPFTEVVAQSSDTVRNHQLGLGAIQKRRGAWDFKHSERLSADRQMLTVQIIDGYTIDEVLAQLVAQLGELQPLFRCDGRDCGNPVQWANRVFNQRILYGRDDNQRYRAYQLNNGDYLLMYGCARTSARQYLHLELWQPLQSGQPDGDKSAVTASQ